MMSKLTERIEPNSGSSAFSEFSKLTEATTSTAGTQQASLSKWRQTSCSASFNTMGLVLNALTIAVRYRSPKESAIIHSELRSQLGSDEFERRRQTAL